MEVDSRGTHPELHLGTMALYQEPPKFIILGGLGGQNRANQLEFFLPHHDQGRTDTLGKSERAWSLAMYTWTPQSLDAGMSCLWISQVHSKSSSTLLAPP